MAVINDITISLLILAFVVFLYQGQQIHRLANQMQHMEQQGNSLNDQHHPVEQQQYNNNNNNNNVDSIIQQHNQQTLIASNTTEYTWVGDQWIPPHGIPLYSPTDLLNYFQNRNVLWIGDSTARRTWATAHAMMNATDRNDIPIRDLDIHAVVDVHKRNISPERQCVLEDRAAWRETEKSKIDRKGKLIFDQYECRDLPKYHEGGDNTDDGKETDHGGGTNATTTKKTGRFDFTFYTCYSQVAWLIRDDKETEPNPLFSHIKEDYDLIIIGLGIWEIIHPEKCDENGKFVPHKDRLHNLLDNGKQLSSPTLQVLYRSCAYDARDEYLTDRVKDFSKVVYDFFDEYDTHSHYNNKEEKEKGANFTLVDWATPVAKRSFGDDRIRGDLPPHYGLQARTLFIQQLIHTLMKAEAKGKQQ